MFTEYPSIANLRKREAHHKRLPLFFEFTHILGIPRVDTRGVACRVIFARQEGSVVEFLEQPLFLEIIAEVAGLGVVVALEFSELRQSLRTANSRTAS